VFSYFAFAFFDGFPLRGKAHIRYLAAVHEWIHFRNAQFRIQSSAATSEAKHNMTQSNFAIHGRLGHRKNCQKQTPTGASIKSTPNIAT
jgi:hypothetical protein